MTEEPKKSTFKVVDRRRFDEEGTARTGPDVRAKEEPKPIPVKAAPAPAAAPQGLAGAPGAAEAPQKPGKPGPASGLTFLVFMQSLAQQALMQLGLIPWPHGQRELQLDAARDTIDIISLIKDKSKGNLTPEESQYVDRALYELRMGAVEVEQAIMRSRGGGVPGKPGMGGPMGPGMGPLG